LTYSGGAVCPATGAARSFVVNVLCDKNVDGDYLPVATPNPDNCDQSVNVVSRFGCSILDVNQIWEFLAEYEYYFGAFFIVAGAMLCFVGRKLIKPSVCIAGFLTCIFIGCILFYTIYLND